MKKFLLLAVAMMSAAMSFAQVAFRVEAGPNFSSYTVKPEGDSKETSKIKVNLRAGVGVDLPLAKEFYINTGLFYLGKGGVDKDDSNFKTTLSYLQLPINFEYKTEVGKGIISLGAGPYVAYGLGGKSKYEAGGVSTEVKMFDDAAGNAKLKRFDAGAGINFGYTFPMNLYVGLNADLGLANALDNTDVGKWHNTSFAVSVGYAFGGKTGKK